jgi:hypothetical protein
MLFLFIGIIYLFFSYGTVIGGLPFITYEGLHETAIQFSRLWIWIESGILLSHFSFHLFFFRILQTFFPSHSSTFSAGLITMDLFPEIIQMSQKKDIIEKLNFFQKPVFSFRLLLERLLTHIENDIYTYFLDKHESKEIVTNGNNERF